VALPCTILWQILTYGELFIYWFDGVPCIFWECIQCVADYFAHLLHALELWVFWLSHPVVPNVFSDDWNVFAFEVFDGLDCGAHLFYYGEVRVTECVTEDVGEAEVYEVIAFVWCWLVIFCDEAFAFDLLLGVLAPLDHLLSDCHCISPVVLAGGPEWPSPILSCGRYLEVVNTILSARLLLRCRSSYFRHP
jgi:hypothetical protein